MQCERVCPRRTFAASRGGCKPGTVRRVLSLSSRRGERGFSPASRARGCRRYQGRRACRPAAKRPDRATWVVPRLELFRPSHDKLMGRPFLFCPNVKITPRTFTRRFTLCRRNSPNSMPRRAPRIASIRTGAEPPDILEDGAVAALADRVQHGTHIRFHGLIGVVAVFQKPQQFRPHGF